MPKMRRLALAEVNVRWVEELVTSAVHVWRRPDWHASSGERELPRVAGTALLASLGGPWVLPATSRFMGYP